MFDTIGDTPRFFSVLFGWVLGVGVEVWRCGSHFFSPSPLDLGYYSGAGSRPR